MYRGKVAGARLVTTTSRTHSFQRTHKCNEIAMKIKGFLGALVLPLLVAAAAAVATTTETMC